MVAYTGANAHVEYGWETTFGTAVDGTIPFGHAVKVSTLERSNNSEVFWGLGSVEACNSVVKKYAGTFSIEFILGNAYWLRALTGVTSTDTGSDPYVHTFIANAGDLTANTQSITINYGVELGTTDHSSQLEGCLVNSMNLSASAGEPVRVTLEGSFANESTGTTAGSLINDTYCQPMTFAHGTLELPDATPLACVQSVEISITRNAQAEVGIGSRFANAPFVTNTEIEITAELLFNDVTLLQSFFGGTDPASTVAESTLDLTFNNGLLTDELRELQLTFGGLVFDSFTLPLDPNEALKQTLTLKARTITKAVYKDDTAVAL